MHPSSDWDFLWAYSPGTERPRKSWLNESVNETIGSSGGEEEEGHVGPGQIQSLDGDSRFPQHLLLLDCFRKDREESHKIPVAS